MAIVFQLELKGSGLLHVKETKRLEKIVELELSKLEGMTWISPFLCFETIENFFLGELLDFAPKAYFDFF